MNSNNAPIAMTARIISQPRVRMVISCATKLDVPAVARHMSVTGG